MNKILHSPKLFKKEYKLLLVGLSSSGKTTLLYKLKLGDRIATVPTVGCIKEKVLFKSTRFEIFDIGGHEKIRDIWYQCIVQFRSYLHVDLPRAHGIIWVLDSTDKSRIKQSMNQLEKLMESPFIKFGIPILICCNKQDLEEALPLDELSTYATCQAHGHPWKLVATVASSGEGLDEEINHKLGNHYDFNSSQGMDWLVKLLNFPQSNDNLLKNWLMSIPPLEENPKKEGPEKNPFARVASSPFLKSRSPGPQNDILLDMSDEESERPKEAPF